MTDKHPQVKAELMITATPTPVEDKPENTPWITALTLSVTKLERVEAVCFEQGFLACVSLLKEQRQRALAAFGPDDSVFRVLDAVCDEKLTLLGNALATLNYPEHDPFPPVTKVNDVGY